MSKRWCYRLTFILLKWVDIHKLLQLNRTHISLQSSRLQRRKETEEHRWRWSVGFHSAVWKEHHYHCLEAKGWIWMWGLCRLVVWLKDIHFVFVAVFIEDHCGLVLNSRHELAWFSSQTLNGQSHNPMQHKHTLIFVFLWLGSEL